MDDDLVLNILVDDVASKKVSVAKKGGRWVERLKVNRSLKRKSRTSESTSGPAFIPPEDIKQPPRKKARTEIHGDSNTSRPTGAHSSVPQPRPSLTVPNTSNRPTQIISSLFSYNPRVELPVVESQAPNVPSPSNAPLATSTFPGLGLHPLLISHLTNKMGIEKPTAIQRAALPILLSDSKNTRDVFLQSQTGSGKTLCYLLPLIQDLLPLSSLSYIDRSIGTLAVIIAPTRELARQISDVVENILKMRLRPESDSTGELDTSTRLTRWLVSGLLIGGATRTHEKARLRKGVPILVSTPGRLLDHLQNTSSFNVGKCRWLILDEADQLMDLGFEESIKGIIQGLDGRRRLAKQAIVEGKSNEVAGWDWERRRRTILCSATIRDDVQKLAGTALKDPIAIKATEVDKDNDTVVPLNSAKGAASSSQETFTPPSQLLQRYMVVPLKLRLVTLVALLRILIARTQARKGAKIIVFLSCTDSVDFHWSLLTGSKLSGGESDPVGDSSSSTSDVDDTSELPGKKADPDRVYADCPLLPGVTLYRLHGSLTTHARLKALQGFSARSKTQDMASSVLFCTSVASRGLDLPLVRAVIQYDPPTEGGVTEYVHRVGRTARAGKGGEAWTLIAPNEVAWVKWAEGKLRSEEKEASGPAVSLSPVTVEEVLRFGFGGKGNEFEERATEVQLSFERWVLRSHDNSSIARKAYQSHMRAYATHPISEKHIFHIRNLHLGHLAKAFALREAPNQVKMGGHKHLKASRRAKSNRNRNNKVDDRESKKNFMPNHSEHRMQAVVRAQGRLSKKLGVMASTGVSEFQISGTSELEKLLRK